MSINSISQTIQSALMAAGLGPKPDALKTVSITIEKALAAAGLAPTRVPLQGRAPSVFRAPPSAAPDRAAQKDSSQATDVGQFLTLSHANSKGRRAYKLYVPSSYTGNPLPLIVMLHGCKQNPDDFARGTRMNELAEREGFFVAYPAQTARENGSNCWNWFESSQQNRDGVEPSIIAGIVGEIGQSHAVDTSRVFVAGLSAGAAMAVVMGTAYPEIFAGVAAHSGLPVGAAHDMPSAFAAMQGRGPLKEGRLGLAVPTIVIHGDADATVSRANGDAIVEQSLLAHERSDAVLQKRPRPSSTSNGRSVTTTDYVDGEGRHRIEEWVVHGGAHTWFGGSPQGSYTDREGPDASAEIVRFFLHPFSAEREGSTVTQ